MRSNILGKDKQEKVNSIVVMAKLLDCVSRESVTVEFTKNLDHNLFETLFTIISTNMSTETYKAILKICVITMSGSVFKSDKNTIKPYLPVYESLIEHLDVIDIMTEKLYLEDSKIIYNSIRLIVELIDKALSLEYEGIVTTAGRLKHVTFFSTVGNLIESDDKLILEAIASLKMSYYNLIQHLRETRFDLAIKAHQTMLSNLFIFLDVSLNENGVPASTEEYIKAGFTSTPKQFVVDNFSILLAMDLKVFLKDPNFSFKKKFHEELMMSDHNRTFPLYIFIEKVLRMWFSIFSEEEKYPNIHSAVLSWVIFIYYTMNNCIFLWRETNANLDDQLDIDKIIELLRSDVDRIEKELVSGSSIEDVIDITASKSLEDLRHAQISKIASLHKSRWEKDLGSFSSRLYKEVMDFVREQRVIQLVKGSWVYTVEYADALLNNYDSSKIAYKYYFMILSPDRRQVFFKPFPEKTTMNPSYAELEDFSINLRDIVDFQSTRKGEHIGEKEKRNNDKLIIVKGTISYHKISFMDKNSRPILSFYTDTEVNKFVWLDGLKMLKGLTNGDQLSEETKKQLNLLVDIRFNTQLLELEDKFLESSSLDSEKMSDDDTIYSLDNLAKASEGFFYA